MLPHKSTEIRSCSRCGLEHSLSPLKKGETAICTRCGESLAKNSSNSLQNTAAFSLSALFLFIPANIFPILHFDLYGATTDNTVWQGVLRLYEDGDVAVAAIVFLASIVIPLIKLGALLFLVSTTKAGSLKLQTFRGALHNFLDLIVRWAMLDVFLVAILVSLVKLQKLATILPGPGLFAFTSVVVLTLLATASFDSRSIWEKSKNE